MRNIYSLTDKNGKVLFTGKYTGVLNWLNENVSPAVLKTWSTERLNDFVKRMGYNLNKTPQ